MHRNENGTRHGEFKIFRGEYCPDIMVIHIYIYIHRRGNKVISEEPSVSVFLPSRPLVKPSL